MRMTALCAAVNKIHCQAKEETGDVLVDAPIDAGLLLMRMAISRFSRN